MKFSTQKGFTLIELLVVISIIGLLSSVVLASVNTAREKGRLAAGQQFSGYNSRTLGSDAFGIWNFDDASGNASDTSGNGFDLTANGSPSRSTTDRAVNKGSSVSLNGSTQYFNRIISPSVSFPSQSSGMTVSVWIKPPATVLPGWVLINDSATRLFGLYVHPSFIQISACINLPNITYALKGGVWQNIAYTYTSNSSIATLYVDGKAVNTAPVSSPCAVSSRSISNITLGSLAGAPDFFTGSLDEAAIYTQSLQASDIEQIYVQGLSTHSLADAQ